MHTKQGLYGLQTVVSGIIFLVLLALYAIEAGYLTGLLFIGRVVRGTSYKSKLVSYIVIWCDSKIEHNRLQSSN